MRARRRVLTTTLLAGAAGQRGAGVIGGGAATRSDQTFPLAVGLTPGATVQARPDDTDVDVPSPPTLFRRGGQDVVTFGGKNGAVFLRDPANMAVLARRQLLRKDAGGNPLPAVDPHAGPGENLWGVFESAAVDPVLGHVYYGLGGYEGIDGATTPFLRACDWTTLADAWPTAVGADGATRYTTPQPRMYSGGEAGLSSPAVVNDVVFVSTTKPALYAFASSNGVPLWVAPGFPSKPENTFSVGPAISGNFVVVGAGNEVLIYGF